MTGPQVFLPRKTGYEGRDLVREAIRFSRIPKTIIITRWVVVAVGESLSFPTCPCRQSAGMVCDGFPARLACAGAPGARWASASSSAAYVPLGRRKERPQGLPFFARPAGAGAPALIV